MIFKSSLSPTLMPGTKICHSTFNNYTCECNKSWTHKPLSRACDRKICKTGYGHPVSKKCSLDNRKYLILPDLVRMSPDCIENIKWHKCVARKCQPGFVHPMPFECRERNVRYYKAKNYDYKDIPKECKLRVDWDTCVPKNKMTRLVKNLNFQEWNQLSTPRKQESFQKMKSEINQFRRNYRTLREVDNLKIARLQQKLEMCDFEK